VAQGSGDTLLWFAAGTQLQLDCARPATARKLVGRVILSEIEGPRTSSEGPCGFQVFKDIARVWKSAMETKLDDGKGSLPNRKPDKD